MSENTNVVPSTPYEFPAIRTLAEETGEAMKGVPVTQRISADCAGFAVHHAYASDNPEQWDTLIETFKDSASEVWKEAGKEYGCADVSINRHLNDAKYAWLVFLMGGETLNSKGKPRGLKSLAASGLELFEDNGHKTDSNRRNAEPEPEAVEPETVEQVALETAPEVPSTKTELAAILESLRALDDTIATDKKYSKAKIRESLTTIADKLADIIG